MARRHVTSASNYSGGGIGGGFGYAIDCSGCGNGGSDMLTGPISFTIGMTFDPPMISRPATTADFISHPDICVGTSTMSNNKLMCSNAHLRQNRQCQRGIRCARRPQWRPGTCHAVDFRRRPRGSGFSPPPQGREGVGLTSFHRNIAQPDKIIRSVRSIIPRHGEAVCRRPECFLRTAGGQLASGTSASRPAARRDGRDTHRSPA